MTRPSAAPLPPRAPAGRDRPPRGAATTSRRGFLGLTLGAGAALALGACGGERTAGAGGALGTLKWAWDLPTSWDPVTSSAGWDVHVLSLVYAALTKLDTSGEPVPALASGWEYAPDGTAVTFTLRPGLVFGDGTPLDATAVKKSLDRGRTDPGSLVAPQLATVRAVSAPDPRTVVIELTEPDYQIPALLAGKTGMIVNPAVFEHDPGSLATRPNGAGPYVLTSYVQNSRAQLRRNPGYWDAENILVENFEVYPRPEPATAVAALQSGQYNLADIPGSQVEAATAAGLHVQIIPSMVVAVLDVNIEKEPFTRPEVVEALKYAVDRQEILDTVAFGYGEVSYQPFPPGYAGHSPNLEHAYPHDPARARELLAAAGHPDGVDVTLTTAEPEGVPELLQAQLAEAGFRVEIETIPSTQTTQIVYIQHSKALYTDRFAGRESAVQAFQVLFGEEGLMNPGRRTPPELAEAVEAARRTPLDSPDYPAILQHATEIAVRTMPNVFLYTVPRILARTDAVSEIPSYPVVQRFEGVTAA